MEIKKCLLKKQEKKLIKSYREDLDYFRKKLDKDLEQLEKAAKKKDTHEAAIYAMSMAKTGQKLVDTKKQINAIKATGYRRAEQAKHSLYVDGFGLWTGTPE